MSAASDNAMAAAGMRSALGDIYGDYLQSKIVNPQAALLNVQAQQAQRDYQLKNTPFNGPTPPTSGAPSTSAPDPSDWSNLSNLPSKPGFPSQVFNADGSATGAASPQSASATPASQLAPASSATGSVQSNPTTDTYTPLSGGSTVNANTPKPGPSPTPVSTAKLPPVIPSHQVTPPSLAGSALSTVGSAVAKGAKNLWDADTQPVANIWTALTGSPGAGAPTANDIAAARNKLGINRSQPASAEPMQGSSSPAKKIGETSNQPVQKGSSSSSVAANTQPPTQAGSTTQGAPLPRSDSDTGDNSSASGMGVTYFQDLPPDQQQQTLGQMRSALAKSGFNYSDAELVSEFNRRAQSSMAPTAMLRMAGASGLVPTAFDQQNGFKFSRPMTDDQGNRQIFDPAQYSTAFDNYSSSMRSDPAIHNFWDTRTYASQAVQAAQQAEQAEVQGGAKANPGMYDKQLVMSYLKSVDQTVRVNQSEEAIEQSIGQYPIAQVPKEKLDQVLYGGAVLTPQARAAILKNTMDNLEASRSSASSSVDNIAAQAKAGGILPNQVQAFYTGFRPQDITPQALLGQSQPGTPQLPPVNVTGNSVQSPAGNQSLPTIQTVQDLAQLPRGAHFIYQGQERVKP